MNEMMSSGVELMITGMGIVYLFLAMLVVAIEVMASVVARYFPQPAVDLASTHKENDPAIIAAISAAVHKYRNKNSDNTL